ncbi:murein L,D-transpeptidase catalytic domain family protein, partial [bacterium]|nr:murein L,D-transpeptidase catalytic domain family protein [bacterium]
MKETLKNPKYLTVVDFTKPNNKNRFYVIDMTTHTI